MAKFKYKIQNKNNEIVGGEKEAVDRFALARELKDQGFFPVSIEEIKDKNKGLSIDISFLKKVSLSTKIMFTNNLSGMLSAGLSLTRALAVLEKQTSKGPFSLILKDLIESINKGNSLSDGMKKYPKVFSGIFIPMIHTGEESGNLSKTLSEVGLNLKKSYDLNKKIKGAMIYPLIIFIVLFIIGIFMMIYVVPTLTSTFKEIGTDLPASTKAIIWLSDMLSQHFILFFLSIALIVGGIIASLKIKKTRQYLDFIVLRVPVIGKLVKEVNTARTTRTLSSLLLSGVNISKSLSITEDVLQNFYYKEIIRNSIISVEKGEVLSASFKNNTHLYPVMVGEMIEVGEETGNLSKMLLNIADFFEGEVDNKTKNLSTIIEPFLMVFIGVAVGFFAVSMIAPMYSVMEDIK